MKFAKFRREDLGLSLDDVQGLSGINRTYISFIEKGQFIPTEAQLGRLAQALRVHPPSALLDDVTIASPVVREVA